MVSLQAALISSSEGMKPKSNNDISCSRSKKRKLDDAVEEGDAQDITKAAKITTEKLDEFVELHMDSPLPLEWQRCLDIKSGKIHFYNTRTQMRTSEDPRANLKGPSSHMVSLDLELNLSVEPNRTYSNSKDRLNKEFSSITKSKGQNNLLTGNSSGLLRSLSWMPFDAGDEQEMVAAVCMRCHMLVMMCKATPLCPNCKFIHPPPDRKSLLLKPEFKLCAARIELN